MSYKIIYSNSGKEIFVDNEYYEILIKYNWNDYTGYARTFKRKNGKFYSLLMHRIILNLTDNKIKVDHINGNGLDNRKQNLRLATTQENGYNRKVNKNNTSGYKGVVYHKRDKRYQCSIKINGKRIHLGYFKTAIEAAKAYNEAAIKYFGEFARLNKL